MSDRIVIELSKKKIVLLLIAGVAFVIFGCLGAISPDTFVSPLFRSPEFIRISGVAAVTFFGIGTLFIARKLFDSKPGLIIDQNGITDNSNAIGIGLIEWQDITRIQRIEIVSTKILILHINKPEKYIERAKSYIVKKAMLTNQKMYGSPISITSNSLKISFEDLETLLKQELKKNK
ncbi:MAG: STM3941 family protein [Bacteroidota bacterium]